MAKLLTVINNGVKESLDLDSYMADADMGGYATTTTVASTYETLADFRTYSGITAPDMFFRTKAAKVNALTSFTDVGVVASGVNALLASLTTAGLMTA